MSGRAIEDLEIVEQRTYSGEHRTVELVDDVTETLIRVSKPNESLFVWLQPEHIVELRDWCTEWLALHNTLRIGGGE